MSLNIIGIMAVTPEGVVGDDNGLPWNYPGELDHFRQTTKGHVIVMGRKTFEKMPSNLFQDRTPIVFSRNHPLNVTITHQAVASLEVFIPLAKSCLGQKIFMIGGAEIAHLFLNTGLIREFLLTKIHKSYKGNTYIDLKFLNDWPGEIINSTPDYTITHLKNPNGGHHVS